MDGRTIEQKEQDRIRYSAERKFNRMIDGAPARQEDVIPWIRMTGVEVMKHEEALGHHRAYVTANGRKAVVVWEDGELFDRERLCGDVCKFIAIAGGAVVEE